jgi:hypothetical protein
MIPIFRTEMTATPLQISYKLGGEEIRDRAHRMDF